MSKYIGEHADIKNALLLAGASTANSQPFSLRDVSRVTVECAIMVTALDTAKQIAAAPASFTVVCGTNQDCSSMAVLTSANLDLGEASALEFNKWEIVQVIAGAGATARKADGRKIQIDGTTFLIQEAATLADKQLSASANSAFIEAFVSAIATHCTHLETFDVVTAADSSSIAYCSVRRKDYGPGMSKSITISSTLASASTGCVYVAGVRKCGVIEFRPADVLATNSSYTHFGVRFKSTGAYNAAASVIRVTGLQSTNDNRKECKK